MNEQITIDVGSKFLQRVNIVLGRFGFPDAEDIDFHEINNIL
jgi:hypothetical protein